MSLLDKLFTVKEAAEILGLSDSHVRQICIELKLGTKAGSVRFLSAAEIERIRMSRNPIGRPKSGGSKSRCEG